MPAACVYMRVNDVQKKWIFNWRVIGDVDCCVCVWGTTGVKSALAITATSRSQSCRPARLLPAVASSASSASSPRKRIKIEEAAPELSKAPGTHQRDGHPAAAGTSRCDSDMWSIQRFTNPLLHPLQMLLRGTAWPIRVICTIGVPFCILVCMYLRLGKVNMIAWRCLQLANEVIDCFEQEAEHAGIGGLN